MNNFWLKFKVWTKTVVAVLVLVYALIFILMNRQSVQLWYFFGRDPYNTPLLLLIFFTFILGIIFWILIRTSLKTMKQFQDLRTRSRHEKLEREMADMKAKAARLQTRPMTSDAVDAPHDVL